MKERPDCLTCGLCCSPHQDQESFCDVTEADLKRLDPKWVRRHALSTSLFDLAVATIDGHHLPQVALKTQWKKAAVGPLRGFEACVCVALKGTLMHRVSCSIYERRPRACRVAVKPGDRTCFHVRKVFHDFITRDR